REAADGDVLTELAYLLRNQLLNADGLFLDEGLLEEADFFVELGHLSTNGLLDDRGRLAGSGSLGAVDLLLALEVFGSHVFRLYIAGISGCDVHGDVLHQVLEILGAGDEIALAVDFQKDANLAACVDVGADGTLVGAAGSFLLRRSHAALAKHNECLLDV